MSLLNNLRQQASDRQASEEAEAERQAELKNYYQVAIQPRLVSLYRNLHELVQHLNYLKHDVKASYPFTAEGNTLELTQSDYKVEIDSLDKTKDISFYCKCRGKRELVFQVGDPKMVDKHEDFLKDYNFKYHVRRYKNDSHQVVGADFNVQTEISIRLQFKADIENKCIRLSVANLPKLGNRQFQLRPEQLDEQFFDDLGHFILREKDDFLSLDISESEKERIRQQVQKEMRERQAELKQAEMASEEEKPAGFFKKIGFQ